MQADTWGEEKNLSVSLCEKEGWCKEIGGGMETVLCPHRLVIFINKSSATPRLRSSVPMFLFFFPISVNLTCNVCRKHELLKLPEGEAVTYLFISHTGIELNLKKEECREMDKKWERRDHKDKKWAGQIVRQHETHQGDGNGKINSDSLFERKKPQIKKHKEFKSI